MGAIEPKLGVCAPEQVWISGLGVEDAVDGSLCVQNGLTIVLAHKMLAEVEGTRGLFGFGTR